MSGADIVEMSKFLGGDVSNIASGIATMATHPNATRYMMGKAGGWVGYRKTGTF